MHYAVRVRMVEAPGIPGPAYLPEAMQAVHKTEVALGGWSRWALIEPTLARCQTTAEALEACAGLPTTFKPRTRDEAVPVREPATELVQAYQKLEPEFRQSMWPRHQAMLEKAAGRIANEFLPRQAECLEMMCQHLNIQDPRVRVPVYLVTDAPRPGAFTHRHRDGFMSIVSIGGVDGSLLYEAIIHEMLHVLDVTSADQNTVLNDLRARLRAAGLGPPAAAFHDVPHTLMFVESGEVIRRCVASNHLHYGEEMGYYDTVPELAQTVRPAWTEYLDGKISRQAALDRIMDALTKGKPAGSE